MMKNCQHQHKGKAHVQEKSQSAAISVEGAITNSVNTCEIDFMCMYLKNVVNSMPKRLQDIIRREGNPSKY
jgi:hypothetical protein